MDSSAKPSLLELNLAFLEAHAGVLTQAAVRSALEAPSRLKAVPSGDGLRCEWLFEEPDGRSTLLHSRRDPEGEAARQLREWLASGERYLDGLVVVLGSAGLHHVLAVADALKPGASLLVMEPLPEVLAASLRHLRLDSLAREGVSLHFSSGLDLPGMLGEFRYFLGGRNDLRVSVFAHPSSRRLAPEAYERLLEGLLEQTRLEAMNRGTKARFMHEWVCNSLRSLPFTLRAPSVEVLKDSFKGCLALVVGAGPSLDRTLERIAPYRSSCLVLALGTALKPMLAKGFKPDFAVAVDNDPKTLRQFEGLDLSGIRLASCMSMYPELLRLFPGRSFIFSANLSAELNSWLESFGALPSRLTVGGTVAVTAMDLARLLGCSRIALCGIDLSVASDGRTHASGSIYDGARGSDLVEVEGNYQSKVMTTRQLSLYVKITDNNISVLSSRYGIEVVNVNDAGARLPNARLVRPGEEACLASGASPEAGLLLADSILASGSSPGRPPLALSLKALGEAASSLEALASSAQRALALSESLFSATPESRDALLAELDRVDASMDFQSGGGLLASAALHLLSMDMLGSGGAFSRKEEAFAANKRLYSHVEDAARGVAAILRDSMKELEA